MANFSVGVENAEELAVSARCNIAMLNLGMTLTNERES